MAALFIFGEGRIVLFLFVLSYPQLVGHVGLQSISPAHLGSQDDPGRLNMDSEDSEMVFLNYSTLLSIHKNSRSTPVRHASMHPCPSLHDSGIILLWSRPKYSIPFRSGQSRSISCIVVAILLLCGDVECNPGPPSPSSSNLRFGYINICSAIHKCALIHDFIHDHSLDVMAISETRYRADTPNSILIEVAPDGFSVDHSFLSPTANHPAGGGMALVHRSNVVIQPIQLGNLSPTSFELQVLRHSDFVQAMHHDRQRISPTGQIARYILRRVSGRGFHHHCIHYRPSSDLWRFQRAREG